jgi:predicted ArsR family transcriptional regulator
VERIEAMLREFGGLSAVAIAKRLGRGDRAVRDTLRQLEADGRIRSEGSRRTSLWRLVSDEEKIATRVSELEAARRRDAS